ncbi:TonB-dependent receptor domain-containing protein, partial [Escherichia sp. HC-CC]
ANTSEIGTKWQVLDKRLLLTAALFRTDIENEVEQNDDGTYSQYGKKRVEGYEISVRNSAAVSNRRLSRTCHLVPISLVLA